MLWFKRVLLKIGILKEGHQAFREELEEEIQIHIDQMIEENVAAGMTRQKARSAALRRFGNVLNVKEECRDSWSIRVFDQLIHGLQFAFRLFFRHPSTSLLSVIVLTIGLGIGIGMFAMAKEILWSGIGSSHDDRLFVIRWLDDSNDWSKARPKDYQHLKKNLKSFDRITAYNGHRGSIHNPKGVAYPETYFMQWVSEDFFETLGIKPILGSYFSSSDSQEILASSIVISHRVWVNHFNESRNAIGALAFVQGKAYSVRGVMPKGFSFPSYDDVWIHENWQTSVNDTNASSSRRVELCGLLKQGISIETAKSELEVMAKQLAAGDQQFYKDKINLIPNRLSERDEEVNKATLLTLICALLVLVVSCMNASNLIAARAFKRSYELATRRALGASRSSISIFVLLDAFLISTAGAIGGWLLAGWGCAFSNKIIGNIPKAPAHYHFELDNGVALFAIGATLLAAILSGIVPALRASKANMQELMSDGSGTSSSKFIGKLAKFMIGFQIAVSGAMLIVSLVTTHEIRKTLEMPLGVDSEQILIASLNPGRASGIDSRIEILNFHDQLKRELEGLPNIESVALTGSAGGIFQSKSRIRIEGIAYTSEEEWSKSYTLTISQDAFKTYGVDLRVGRDFDQFDTIDNRLVCIVSDSFAKEHWPNENPIGKRIANNPEGPWYSVIGVAPDILKTNVQRDPKTAGKLVYFHVKQKEKVGGSTRLIARGKGDLSAQVASIRKSITQLLPHFATSQIRTMDEYWESRQESTKFFALIFSVFGTAVLFKAFTGLYAMMLFASKNREREFGIRIAIGALPINILRSAFSSTFAQMMVGLALGLGIGYGISSVIVDAVMDGQPNTSPLAHPSAYTIAILVVLSASVLATGIPAWKASTANPLQALREE